MTDSRSRFPDWVLAYKHDSKLMNYALFETMPKSEFMSLMPYQLRAVKSAFAHFFPRPPALIVDGNAHIGGDSVHFGEVFDSRILAIEKDRKTFECLQRNIARFLHPSRSKVLHADLLGFLNLASGSDRLLFPNEPVGTEICLFLDPPWGTSRSSLTLNEIAIERLIAEAMDRRSDLTIVLKVPPEFDGSRLNIEYDVPILKPKCGLAYRLLKLRRRARNGWQRLPPALRSKIFSYLAGSKFKNGGDSG